MNYKVVTATSANDLNNTVNRLIQEGWTPKGSHSVVITRIQNRFSGSQHMDSLYKQEFSQTMIKEAH